MNRGGAGLPAPDAPRPSGPVVWAALSSPSETGAAVGLLDRLRALRPEVTDAVIEALRGPFSLRVTYGAADAAAASSPASPGAWPWDRASVSPVYTSIPSAALEPVAESGRWVQCPPATAMANKAWES